MVYMDLGSRRRLFELRAAGFSTGGGDDREGAL